MRDCRPARHLIALGLLGTVSGQLKACGRAPEQRIVPGLCRVAAHVIAVIVAGEGKHGMEPIAEPERRLGGHLVGALGKRRHEAEARRVVREIGTGPGVDAQRGSVEVKLDVPQPPAYLREDMTVSVDVEVARRPAAVLVPTDAVHESGSAAPWVMKVEDGHARRRPVKLGLRSRGWCEVLSGLAAGDAVLPATGPAALQVADGARVRPVRQAR